MKYSLRVKLSFSYAIVAILSILLIMFISNIFLDKHFREYVNQNYEQKNKDIVTSISKQYQDNGKWNMDMIETIGVSALEDGMILKIIDINSKIIWDATIHNNGMCQRIIEHMAHNVNSRYPNAKAAFTEIPYPVKYNNVSVGKVEIGSYGPYYLSDNDLAFIDTLNKLIIGVGVFSLLFSLLFGSIMARRLTSPISRVISSAQAISKGYFSDRILEKSSTSEICQLTTTINNLAETLEKQEDLRKKMSLDVAHELRTPLATLQSHMEAMIDGIWKPEVERLISCHEEIIRINKMVGDIEMLAKYESESIILNKEKFDVSELIQLLSNAFKYTPNNGLVNVYVKGAMDTTEIIVHDNGLGIPKEDLPFIFERFFRVDKSRNRMTGGSGIGLAIVKSIIDAHKGKIIVQSIINEGSEFIISLPKGVL